MFESYLFSFLFIFMINRLLLGIKKINCYQVGRGGEGRGEGGGVR